MDIINYFDNLLIIQSPIIENFIVSEPGKSSLNNPKTKILTDEVSVKICDEIITLTTLTTVSPD